MVARPVLRALSSVTAYDTGTRTPSIRLPIKNRQSHPAASVSGTGIPAQQHNNTPPQVDDMVLY